DPAPGVRSGARQPLDRPRRRDAGDRRQRPPEQPAPAAQLHQRPRHGSGAGAAGTAAGPGRADARRLRSRLLAERVSFLARRAAAAARRRGRDRVRLARRRPAPDRHPRTERLGARGWDHRRARQAMSRSRVAAAIAAVVLIALGAAGVWLIRAKRPPPIAAGSCRGCNLLLVTIDTLRADRVGAFGSARGLTPTLDRLAAGGLRL